METTFDVILKFGVAFIFLLVVIILLLILFYWIVIYPICNYYLEKGNNKLQWKAVETFTSATYSSYRFFDKNKERKYDLYYRVLPTELPYLVKVFGNNKWQFYDSLDDGWVFSDKEEFIKFVSKHPNYCSIEEMNIEKRTIWIHP